MAGYIVYTRKSTDSEDRQVLSLDTQARELRSYARARGLDIVEELRESRSAKAPGRPLFAAMLQKLKRRQATGILCWRLDRLSRNPIDGGTLIWALDQGAITDIVTPGRTYTNRGDDKLWMTLDFGMAKKYIDDLQKAVKDGNTTKLELGWLPGMAPTGYLNDVVTKTIVPDPERFEQVRQILELFLAGRSVREILQVAEREWHFRVPRRGKIGGGPLTQSLVYRMLTNPFYCGLIVRNGVPYLGAHEPLVPKAKFDRIQEMLGKPNRRAPEAHDFAFTGLIRCGECGNGVTAEHKVQRHGHRYVYYHCSRRKLGFRCPQPSVEVAALETQIATFLRRIRIDDAMLAWGLRELQAREKRDRAAAAPKPTSLGTVLQETRKESAALLDLRLRGLISDDDYRTKKEELTEQELRIKERVLHEETAPKRWIEPAVKTFRFANQAPKRFPAAANGEKREILISLGSNLVLQDRTLRMEAKKPFLLMEEGRRISDWSGTVKRLRTWFMHHEDDIPWPSFCRNGSDQDL